MPAGSGNPLLVRAAMVVDADAVCAAPGAVLIHENSIVSAGDPEAVTAPPGATVIERTDLVVMPALVNAHCHLDLTSVGGRSFDGDFGAWLGMIRTARPGDDTAIAGSVRRGVALARAGGTALVGDIAGMGSAVPARVLRDEGIGGVSYREIFGLGAREPQAVAAVGNVVAEDVGGVLQGIQPHAPYSCGPDVYRAAVRSGMPIATHLAETLEEIRFLDRGDGPIADMLRRFGVWDDSIAGLGRHPVDAVLDWLDGAAAIAAHGNYLGPGHAAALAASSVTIAYCPRASAYFGHPHSGADPHPYRTLMAAGVNVALGTDSMVCLDTPDRISVLDEMRLLYRRDGVEPRCLLDMATRAGARALGFDEGAFTFRPGATAGVIGIGIDPAEPDPLAAALLGDSAPQWIVGPLSADALVRAGR